MLVQSLWAKRGTQRQTLSPLMNPRVESSCCRVSCCISLWTDWDSNREMSFHTPWAETADLSRNFPAPKSLQKAFSSGDSGTGNKGSRIWGWRSSLHTPQGNFFTFPRQDEAGWAGGQGGGQQLLLLCCGCCYCPVMTARPWFLSYQHGRHQRA